MLTFALLFAVSTIGSLIATAIMWPRRRMTISAGVAEFVSSDSPAALIDAADQALYAAKTLGRNRVEMARMSTATT